VNSQQVNDNGKPVDNENYCGDRISNKNSNLPKRVG
jgi:hypothetical protein